MGTSLEGPDSEIRSGRMGALEPALAPRPVVLIILPGGKWEFHSPTPLHSSLPPSCTFPWERQRAILQGLLCPPKECALVAAFIALADGALGAMPNWWPWTASPRKGGGENEKPPLHSLARRSGRERQKRPSPAIQWNLSGYEACEGMWGFTRAVAIGPNHIPNLKFLNMTQNWTTNLKAVQIKCFSDQDLRIYLRDNEAKKC